ncbi:MAG: ribosome biogenesis GTP-binding protein YihA/YsxC [Ignavibacteria bacterium]|nr:ribosome biogenesis GTP-binding protein YihA/YsxC [Ignavibacteria bacterium]MBT8383835.1 ribosome biogenesis GTP-binding protein YihA/YsxC [Ignavibacteria bacterium]MBT8392083.1 ribosome biogenesis GTP-binding protein YihA/YsxC [Ignavibacteria bacterium]NNJ54030.1 YihA family ribosome biogenesis GTP-binding protein [Ignavibacteriaceae bacterium]NNL21010.1 YihA family ribosome biogenesis GTP-binding protein [Ignavibacteriaceae bacterium]
MLKQISFVKSAHILSQLPKDNLPQLILCGRSNVGKSSFINSLFNRKQIAKTSSTPGKTRSINFYSVDGKFFLVDLPGFGYTKTSKQDREKWGKLINDYIKSSKNIRSAFHLIDSRHRPTELDISLNEWLHFSKIDFSVILNKADKLTQSEFSNAGNSITKTFPELVLNENLFFYSSFKAKWKESVRKKILSLFY